MSATTTTAAPVALDTNITVEAPQGMRKNGKQWKPLKTAFRPKMGNNTYETRQRDRAALNATKAKEKEMKEEKAAEQAEKIAKLKEKRERKTERERYERLALTMHKKRVERLKRKEKRNKMIKS